MDDSTPPTTPDEDDSYVIGQVFGENLEVGESDLDNYEEVAEQEGMSLESFVDNLDDAAILVRTLADVRAEILSWSISGDEIPPYEQIDAAHTELLDATTEVPDYPYTEFYGWLPRIYEYLQETLTELHEVYDSLENVTEMEERAQGLSDSEALLADLQDSRDNFQQIAQGLIENMQSLIEDLPLPEEELDNESSL
jgi:hypothetical protein